MLAERRYNLDLGVFEQVYAATGNDWATALSVFRRAADSPDDPYAPLRAWLAEQAG